MSAQPPAPFLSDQLSFKTYAKPRQLLSGHKQPWTEALTQLRAHRVMEGHYSVLDAYDQRFPLCVSLSLSHVMRTCQDPDQAPAATAWGTKWALCSTVEPGGVGTDIWGTERRLAVRSVGCKFAGSAR